MAADKRKQEQDTLFQIGQQQKHIELLCNYKREHGVRFNMQIPRVKEGDKFPRLVSKQEQAVLAQLPSYFHNANNRASMSFITERSLRKTKKSTQPVYEAPSCFEEKRSFRVDPEQPPGKKSSPSKTPRKGADFGQMLENMGYTIKETNRKTRKRPWHIKKINFTDSSSSDENQ